MLVIVAASDELLYMYVLDGRLDNEDNVADEEGGSAEEVRMLLLDGLEEELGTVTCLCQLSPPE